MIATNLHLTHTINSLISFRKSTPPQNCQLIVDDVHKPACSTPALSGLSSDEVFQETSARYRAVEPEQWLQRHPEAGSSWPSWPQASQMGAQTVVSRPLICTTQGPSWGYSKANFDRFFRKSGRFSPNVDKNEPMAPRTSL